MIKKQLKQLVQESYINNNLDQKKVEKIANLLSRKELKLYIKALKDFENKKTVYVSLPFIPEKEEKKMFNNLFPEKKIVYNIDKSLILGTKIIDYDFVYEINLKNNLDNLIKFIGEENAR